MGLFSKLKEKSRGIMTAAEPAEGVPAAPESEVRGRLLAISGQGIEAGEDDGDIVVAWAAKVDTIGPGGAEANHVYRAIRIELDPSENERRGGRGRQVQVQLVRAPRSRDRRRHRRRLDVQAEEVLTSGALALLCEADAAAARQPGASPSTPPPGGIALGGA
jgi:hypothetical protein